MAYATLIIFLDDMKREMPAWRRCRVSIVDVVDLNGISFVFEFLHLVEDSLLSPGVSVKPGDHAVESL